MKTRHMGTGLLLGMLLFAGHTAEAALAGYTANGIRLVYDDDYGPGGLTWVADANLAATRRFGVDGINDDGTMDWDSAQTWIAAMNAADYAGVHDWRLWSALDLDDPASEPCGGDGCSGSELGHLFYTEGGLAFGNSILDSTLLNAVFTNLQDDIYWSGTGVTGDRSAAWVFYADYGDQYFDDKFQGHHVWAVRAGQIETVKPVPLPPAPLLLELGLIILIRHRVQRGNAPWPR